MLHCTAYDQRLTSKMTNYRYGTYPRSQRIALLAILAVVMAVTVFLSLGAAPALSPDLSSAAAKIRAEEARLEAKNFRAPPESFAFDPNLVLPTSCSVWA